MIDIMDVECPFCGTQFMVDTYVGEAHLNMDACLTKHVKQPVSWKEFAEEIRRGYGRELLSVGDKISFTLQDGTDVSIRVAALDFYSLNSVVFVFDDAYWEASMRRNSDSTEGGWATSSMARYVGDGILPLLPKELSEVIKPRTIIQKLKDGEDNLKTYKCINKLWLPSYTEVFGRNEYYKDCDSGDMQFPLYHTQRYRVKANNDGDAATWWVRSPYYSNSSYFCFVYTRGTASTSSADFSRGVSPAFLI